jgi:hypothetical protein
MKFRTGDMDLAGPGGKHLSARLSATNNARGRRKRRTSSSYKEGSNNASTAAVGPPEDTVDEMLFDDFPIDPNEPTYCLCNRVSFGEMVACDNDDVRFYSSILHYHTWIAHVSMHSCNNAILRQCLNASTQYSFIFYLPRNTNICLV